MGTNLCYQPSSCLSHSLVLSCVVTTVRTPDFVLLSKHYIPRDNTATVRTYKSMKERVQDVAQFLV